MKNRFYTVLFLCFSLFSSEEKCDRETKGGIQEKLSEYDDDSDEELTKEELQRRALHFLLNISFGKKSAVSEDGKPTCSGESEVGKK